MDNLFRYTSGLLDTATGLTKLGIRYYDPTLGRFTQPDPTGQDPHYTYARNNPVNYLDPSGAFSIDNVIAGVALSVGFTVTCAGAAFMLGLNVAADVACFYLSTITAGVLVELASD